MKMKVEAMLQAHEALGRMAGQKMPARAAYWVSRLSAKLRVEYGVAEDKRRELVRKHGVEDEKKNVRVLPEKMPDFMADWQPIAESEIEVEVQPIRLEVFGGADLAPRDLEALDGLVNDEAVPA